MAEYINKSALVAEIERRIEAHKETLKNCDSSISETVLKGSMSAYLSLLHFLDTIEVKEVDLEKEIDRELETRWRGEYLYTTKFKESAKHFFELGLKAKDE